MMARPRFAIIGNSLPRRCGIATFTTDLHAAVAAHLPAGSVAIVAMNDSDGGHAYPTSVAMTIRDDDRSAYLRAARQLNALDLEAVSLQHEFGIFGGRAGRHILSLLSGLKAPVVTTFHTVLARPSPIQRDTIAKIAARSARLVVMSERGGELLNAVYGVPTNKIAIIPHGIPNAPFEEPDAAKERFGYGSRKILLTFGLLAPNKGIEIVIDAMPRILTTTPDAVYVVLGATHPNLVRDEGEAYRERLQAKVRALGISDHVVFLDSFVDQETLLGVIAMCDVYVTPYLNEEQMTSGTLAYSFGLGKAVVSTPYWHARDLLAGGLGLLVPFGDVEATAAAIQRVLTNDTKRNAMRLRAYLESRSMIWERVGQRYLQTFALASGQSGTAMAPPRSKSLPSATDIGLA
jgi:glycosyltransferase involved in cell wall biosynthesis